MFWLMKNIFKLTFLREKKNIILFFFVPLIGILLSFLAYGGGGKSLNIGIINHDQNALSVNVVEFLKGLDNVKISEIEQSELTDKITSNKLDCVITLDSGFSQSVLSGTPNYIQLTSIKGAQVTGFIKSYLYNYIDNLAALGKLAKGNQHTFDQMYTDYLHSNFKLSVETLKDVSKNKNMQSYSIGFLIMLMLFSAGNMAEFIMKDKEQRIYLRLLSTPIGMKKYVAANICMGMFVMIVQIFLTLIAMQNIFHIETGIPLWEMAFILFMFALSAVGISLITVAFSNSASTTGSMQNLIFTPTCLLAGCFWPVDIMPNYVQKIADFLPQRWALDCLTKLQQGQSLMDIYVDIFILLAFACTFFLMAIYRFGRNNEVGSFI